VCQCVSENRTNIDTQTILDHDNGSGDTISGNNVTYFALCISNESLR
jgi:hypothetical protein